MRLKRVGAGAALALALAAATAAFGWWAVPLLSAAYGAASGGRSAWWMAASAAAAGWGTLLALDSLRGPVLALAGRLGGAFGVPGVVVLLATLTFAATAAAAAAGFAAELRAAVSRRGPAPPARPDVGSA